MSAERILVVDDDIHIRQIVRMCLADEGYDVYEAANGMAALEALETAQPDLILLDMRMPVMDGREFARQYSQSPAPRAPIVAFVAALNAEQECADVAAAAILSKPFDLDDLVHAVRSSLWPAAVPD